MININPAPGRGRESTPEDIDIVITWVDPAEESWASAYRTHAKALSGLSTEGSIRFRDWRTLRYLLRGIEQFCPWVRNVYVVTSNSAPTWMNLSNERLHLVHHREIIAERDLPTFNSNAIEANLHRIKGLAERFIYFNDDFFIVAPTDASHFFRNALPTGVGGLNALSGDEDVLHNILNAVRLINRRFSKKHVLSNRRDLWFSPRYGSYMMRTLALLPWPSFTGFVQLHLPVPLLKSTFEKVWEECEDAMVETTRSKFRAPTDVSSYVFQYWQLCENKFAAISPRRYGKYLQIGRDKWEDVISNIEQPQSHLLCINDGPISNFEHARAELQNAFESLLPTASTFEI